MSGNDKGGWIAVDLDGTLARYEGWQGEHHVGDPVPLMLQRVKDWLKEGKEVRIFTARVCRTGQEGIRARLAIEAWLEKHVGQVLQITNQKDYGMIELWDDRCVQVVPNTGRRADEEYLLE